MNKIQPKTKILGQVSVFLPECHSTNDIALDSIRNGVAQNGQLVYTGYQTKGRGQKASQWHSHPNENILASIVLLHIDLEVKNQFGLSMAVAVGIKNALTKILNEACDIKWPNDIYFKNKKLAGILIENVLRGLKILHSVVGFGVNVNQTQFENINATSLKNITAMNVDLEVALEVILECIETEILLLTQNPEQLKSSYLNALMGYQCPKDFIINGQEKTGVIMGVSAAGKLEVQFDVEVRSFDIKEIQMKLF